MPSFFRTKQFCSAVPPKFEALLPRTLPAHIRRSAVTRASRRSLLRKNPVRSAARKRLPRSLGKGLHRPPSLWPVARAYSFSSQPLDNYIRYQYKLQYQYLKNNRCVLKPPRPALPSTPPGKGIREGYGLHSPPRRGGAVPPAGSMQSKTAKADSFRWSGYPLFFRSKRASTGYITFSMPLISNIRWSASMAMNSEFVGLPLIFDTV